MFRLNFADRLKYFVERQFVKGAHYQLLVVIALIGLISLFGGLLVMPTDGTLSDPASAVWWAFLRLTDPGYLGDDEGTWRRIVSTLLTVTGYVLFMGTLVAIITRWLISVMLQLEQGLTPVAIRNHVVILGWTNRTIPLVHELIGGGERVQRFLRAHAAKRLQVVVLSEHVSARHLQLLRSNPGIGARARGIILRSGTPLQPKALHRAACLNAAAIIVPGSSFPQTHQGVSADIETIKALLSLSSQAREAGSQLPYVVAEIEDIRRLAIAHRAYRGPMEVIASDATVSRLIAQNILHPGLSEVYRELLSSHSGNEFYLRVPDTFFPTLTGRETLADAAARCPRAILCGFLRRENDTWTAFLNAASDTTLRADDRLVFLAEDYQHTAAVADTHLMLEKVVKPAREYVEGAAKDEHVQRLLIVGWNRRVPALIAELASYAERQFSVVLVSTVSIARRQGEIAGYSEDNLRVPCEHVQVDYMLEGELRRLNPGNFDAIVMLCSDRTGSGEEADARTIVGYLVLDEILQGIERRPRILLELNDPANETLLVRDRSEILMSPLILSHMLAQIALRRELVHVFDELFTSNDAEILFRDRADYNIESSLSFHELERRVALKGETALGVFRNKEYAKGRRLLLNPPRDFQLELHEGDQVVVLSTMQ